MNHQTRSPVNAHSDPYTPSRAALAVRGGRVRRVIWIGALVAVAVVAAALWLLASNLDAIVARAIERQGSELTGVPVRVASVEIDLRSGRGSVRGVTVGSPAGFEGDAFRLGEISLDVDPASLTSAVIRVDEVVVAAPEVRWVADARGRSNVQAILAHVKQHSKTSEGGEGDASAGEADPETLLVVRRVEFRDGQVAADLAAVGAGTREEKLPPLTLRDLGAPDGAPAGEIGARVAEAYAGQVVRTVAARELGRRIGGALGDEAGEAGRALEGILERSQRR
jgi:hypothetical protein